MILNERGEIVETGFVLIGLSGTGKTSLSGSDHGLASPEGVLNHQDDYVIATLKEIQTKNGPKKILEVKGTELGYYVKTEGMGEDAKDPLHTAALLPDVVFENVAADANGNLEFVNYDMYGTRNGRCVINRRTIANNDCAIDVRVLNTMVLIYRDPFLPPIAVPKSPELAAAAFIALQSVVTSAATQKKEEWGKPTFEAGANPFMVPYTPKGIVEETMLFYNLVREGGARVVLMNTGEVGFGNEAAGRAPAKVSKPVSEEVIAGYAKGEISFRDSRINEGMLVPEEMSALDPENPGVIDKGTFAKKFPESVKAKRGWMEQFEPELAKSGEGRKVRDAFFKSFKE